MTEKNEEKAESTGIRPYIVLRLEEFERKIGENTQMATAYTVLDTVEASTAEVAMRTVYAKNKELLGKKGVLVAVTQRSWVQKSYRPKPPQEDVPVVFG